MFEIDAVHNANSKSCTESFTRHQPWAMKKTVLFVKYKNEYCETINNSRRNRDIYSIGVNDSKLIYCLMTDPH